MTVLSDIDRCRREISSIEAEILAGNRDIEGLCLALSDWWMELRILEQEQRLAPRAMHEECKGETV